MVMVNDEPVVDETDCGWVSLSRRWEDGDTIDLQLPMPIERVSMPPEFKDYDELVALKRGPIVYCLEQQDSWEPILNLCIPEDTELDPDHRAELLGGVTVLTGGLRHLAEDDASPVPVTFVPYAVWSNRRPGPMRMWFRGAQMSQRNG